MAMLGARRLPPAGCARGVGGRGWGIGGMDEVLRTCVRTWAHMGAPVPVTKNERKP